VDAAARQLTRRPPPDWALLRPGPIGAESETVAPWEAQSSGLRPHAEGFTRPSTRSGSTHRRGNGVIPDVVFFTEVGHVAVVEVKSSDNGELRDRRAVAQVPGACRCVP
jgi:hypothetical protein